MKKMILAVLSAITGAAAGAVTVNKLCGKTIEKKSDKINKFKTYYTILDQWLVLKQEGKSLEAYFADNNYKKVAIYGMGEMGARLYDDLKNTSITVKYGIDKNTTSTFSGLDIYDPEETLEPVDLVVVTAVFAYEEIKESLQDKLSCPIVSLEEIICNI